MFIIKLSIIVVHTTTRRRNAIIVPVPGAVSKPPSPCDRDGFDYVFLLTFRSIAVDNLDIDENGRVIVIDWPKQAKEVRYNPYEHRNVPYPTTWVIAACCRAYNGSARSWWCQDVTKCLGRHLDRNNGCGGGERGHGRRWPPRTRLPRCRVTVRHCC